MVYRLYDVEDIHQLGDAIGRYLDFQERGNSTLETLKYLHLYLTVDRGVRYMLESRMNLESPTVVLIVYEHTWNGVRFPQAKIRTQARTVHCE